MKVPTNKPLTTGMMINGLDLVWADLRIADQSPTFLTDGDYPCTVMRAPAAHHCPNDCSGELLWLNRTPMRFGGYWTTCTVCQSSWLMPHKYAASLVPETPYEGVIDTGEGQETSYQHTDVPDQDAA